jgi:hypothetical protein
MAGMSPRRCRRFDPDREIERDDAQATALFRIVNDIGESLNISALPK